MRGLRRIAVILSFAAMAAAAFALTRQVRGPVFSLKTIAKNNSLGSSIPYSTSPLAYPRDIYYVLFDPLPFNSHSSGQHVAAIENTIIVIMVILALKSMRYLPRVAFARPYVLACLLYSAVFPYVFAALSNLGLIDRERVLLLPFLLVILSIPLPPKGVPGSERVSRRRRRRQPSWAQPVPVGGGPLGGLRDQRPVAPRVPEVVNQASKTSTSHSS
jgi:hypothetical protein